MDEPDTKNDTVDVYLTIWKMLICCLLKQVKKQ